MNHTTNYHLPQWEESDRIMMDDFNEAFAAIDTAMPRIAVGTYNGEAHDLPYNGYQTQTITLGFRPKFLLIVTGDSFDTTTGAVLIDDMHIKRNGVIITQITDTGFIAGTSKYENSHSYPELNNLYQQYHYVAIG